MLKSFDNSRTYTNNTVMNTEGRIPNEARYSERSTLDLAYDELRGACNSENEQEIIRTARELYALIDESSGRGYNQWLVEAIGKVWQNRAGLIDRNVFTGLSELFGYGREWFPVPYEIQTGQLPITRIFPHLNLDLSGLQSESRRGYSWYQMADMPLTNQEENSVPAGWSDTATIYHYILYNELKYELTGIRPDSMHGAIALLPGTRNKSGAPIYASSQADGSVSLLQPEEAEQSSIIHKVVRTD
jgi:hypothetical protein